MISYRTYNTIMIKLLMPLIAGGMTGFVTGFIWGVVQPPSFYNTGLKIRLSLSEPSSLARLNFRTEFNWYGPYNFMSFIALVTAIWVFLALSNPPNGFKNPASLPNLTCVRRKLFLWVPVLGTVSGILAFSVYFALAPRSTYEIAYTLQQYSDYITTQREAGKIPAVPDGQMAVIDADGKVKDLEPNNPLFLVEGAKEKSRFEVTILGGAAFTYWYLWYFLLWHVVLRRSCGRQETSEIILDSEELKV